MIPVVVLILLALPLPFFHFPLIRITRYMIGVAVEEHQKTIDKEVYRT